MPFDAGTILGHLDMETGGFTSSILGAESLAQAFGPTVEAFMVSPILGFIEVAKKGGEAAIEMSHKLIDTVVEIGNSAAEAGFAAQKSGVTVEYFSQMAHVAQTVGVSAEQLGTGFKFLQKNAVDAVEGTGQGLKAFNDLGISTQFLKTHLNDVQAIFEKVRENIGALPDPAERTRRAMELLGRQGSDLIPIFALNNADIQELIGTFKELGATETSESARVGGAFKTMETIATSAWEGIKKAVAEPILDFLAKHVNVIVPVIVKGTEFIRSSIENVFAYIEGPSGQKMIGVFQAIGAELLTIGNIIADHFAAELPGQLSLIEKLVTLLGDVLVPTLQALEPILDIILDGITAIDNIVNSITGGVVDAVDGLENLLGFQLPSNAANGQSKGGDTIHNTFNLPEIDSEQAATLVAKKLQEYQKKHNKTQVKQMTGIVNHTKVKRAMGGRR